MAEETDRNGGASGAARLASQMLTGRPARSPEEVVGRLLAVQAQDARGVRLAVRSRSSGLSASDVDHALTTKRSLVVTWVNRGTLHLVAAEDYWWLHPLTTPQLTTGNERRLRQEGVNPKEAGRGVAVITDAVTSEGPQTRGQLRRRLDDAGVPTAGQAFIHVLAAASLGGHVVRGPMVGREQAYVSVADWLGPAPRPVDRGDALRRLARRYLTGHGPASAPDLAKWAGITLGDARRGLDAVTDEARGLGHRVASARPRPRLLGAFDPLLLGWASREPVVGPHAAAVVSGGVIRPVALVDGRVVATWAVSDGAVVVRRLERIPASARQALVDDAADVLRFLGLPERDAVVS